MLDYEEDDGGVDLRSTPIMVGLALQASDDDERWEVVSALHRRSTQELFDVAETLCKSERPEERALGVDILGQGGNEAYEAAAIGVLVSTIENEQHLDVLLSLGYALGHRRAAAGVPFLVALRHHEDPGVREAVVFGLLCQEAPEAVEALIELSRDTDGDVRNWATFGLGSQIDVDTPEVRAALRARLGEEDDEIRGEAFVGLARRKDASIVAQLYGELSGGEICILMLEAAEELGDPALYPVLLELEEAWSDEDGSFVEAAHRAVARCRPKA